MKISTPLLLLFAWLSTAGVLSAQPKLSLSLASGTVRPGGTFILNVSLSGSAGANAAGLGWSMAVPPGFSFTPAIGAAGVAAAKSVQCHAAQNVLRCVLYGVNSNVLGDGLLVTLNGLVDPGIPPGQVSLGLSSTLGANLMSSAVPVLADVPLTFQLASPCDIDGNGVVDSADVNLARGAAVWTAACTADLDRNGICDIVDLQRVVNAALGLGCRVGQ